MTRVKQLILSPLEDDLSQKLATDLLRVSKAAYDDLVLMQVNTERSIHIVAGTTAAHLIEFMKTLGYSQDITSDFLLNSIVAIYAVDKKTVQARVTH